MFENKLLTRVISVDDVSIVSESKKESKLSNLQLEIIHDIVTYWSSVCNNYRVESTVVRLWWWFQNVSLRNAQKKQNSTSEFLQLMFCLETGKRFRPINEFKVPSQFAVDISSLVIVVLVRIKGGDDNAILEWHLKLLIINTLRRLLELMTIVVETLFLYSNSSQVCIIVRLRRTEYLKNCTKLHLACCQDVFYCANRRPVLKSLESFK